MRAAGEAMAPDCGCVSASWGWWHEIAVVQAFVMEKGTESRLCKPLDTNDTGFCPRAITQLASGATGGHRPLHNRDLVPAARRRSLALRFDHPQRPDSALNVRTRPAQEGHGHGLPDTEARTTWDFLEPQPSRNPQRTSAIVHSTQNPAPMRLPTLHWTLAPRDTFLTVAM